MMEETKSIWIHKMDFKFINVNDFFIISNYIFSTNYIIKSKYFSRDNCQDSSN